MSDDGGLAKSSKLIGSLNKKIFSKQIGTINEVDLDNCSE